MFAVLLSDNMTPFYTIISSFPTVIFSFFCLFCAIFWLIAMLGAVDIDFLDFLDFSGVEGAESAGFLGGLSFVLAKLGLNHVPFIITLSFLSLFGWMISSYAVYALSLIKLGALLGLLFNVVIFIGATYLSLLMTSIVVRPLRKLFMKMDASVEKKVLGQVAVVRTSRVDKVFGEAHMDDGAAGLVLKVRSYSDEIFNKGERIVLLDYVESENIYHVVSEKEFTNKTL